VVHTQFLAFYSAAGETTRKLAASRARQILDGQDVLVFSPTHATFLDSLGIYESRPDKAYSLTDCISMHVMRREGITDILTNDHHFEQEGFHLLFR
jgi:uncharacterized protein